jgi:hypothetical protein
MPGPYSAQEIESANEYVKSRTGGRWEVREINFQVFLMRVGNFNAPGVLQKGLYQDDLEEVLRNEGAIP